MIETMAAWLLTVALHGGVLLALAWLVECALRATGSGWRLGAWRESLWRAALFGGVLTATLQTGFDLTAVSGRWPIVPAASDASTSLASPLVEAQSTAVRAPAIRTASASAQSESQRPAKGFSTPTVGSVGLVASLPSWTMLLVCAWLAGALLAVTRVIRSLFALRRALATAAPCDDSAASSDAAALAEQARACAPKLSSLEALASPLATSGGRIILPIWTLSTLDRAQLRAMLAHEVAHLARADPSWKLLVALWRAVFWHIPFGWMAQRRLDELAELACDTFAARATGDGRDLAECLAACAERHRKPAPAFVLAAAMAVRESSFLQRIERLLEGTDSMKNENESGVSNAVPRVLLAFALLASTICLPGIGLSPRVAHAATPATAPTKPGTEPNSHISIHSDNGSDTTKIVFSDDLHRFNASIDGKVSFNADESDVESLSAGGKASFEETIAGVTQRIDVSERGGQIVRRYSVDGTDRPWDAAANTWMRKLIIEVERSGVGAEAREKRIYTASGAKGVLDEIDQIPNDYARVVYVKLLLAHGRLAAVDLDRAMRSAGATRSDYERRQALQAIFETQALDGPQQVAFLNQTLHFDADYERAELLVEIAPKLVDRPDVRQAWLDAALGVRSDYERRRTLTAMLDRPGFDDSQLGAVLDASRSMGSDYERRELLVATIRRARNSEALAPLFARSAKDIASPYERREALLALIRSGQIGVAGTEAVLDAAAGIDSSYDCREVLVELAHVMPRDVHLLERYRKVSGGLGDSDRREAENALVL